MTVKPKGPIATKKTTKGKRHESANERHPEAFYSKIMLVNVTAEPVSGVKAWP
jgi:hypothetical protein